MIELQDLVDSVMVDCPEATEPSIERAIRFAAIEFFQVTKLWRQSKTEALDGSRRTTFTLDDGALIHGTESVHFDPEGDTRPVKLRSTTPEMYAETTGWPHEFYREGHAFVVDGNQLGDLKIDVCVVPSITFTQLPEVTGVWTEVIRCGALSRLYGTPAKPWTDNNAMQLYRMQFEQGLTDARRYASRYQDKPARNVRYGGI